MAKATFGTGAFLVMNMGETPPRSANRLLATVGYETKQGRAYALEGSIFSAGATMQWLRDGLKADQERQPTPKPSPRRCPNNGGVYLVPAFAGLGAPQWNAEARGTIVGLTRDSRLDHNRARWASKRSLTKRRILLGALRADGAQIRSSLLVDGGLTANAWAMQFLADVCDVEVARPAFQEVTALGCGKAGRVRFRRNPQPWTAVHALRPKRQVDAAPQPPTDRASLTVSGWKKAVAATLAAAH